MPRTAVPPFVAVAIGMLTAHRGRHRCVGRSSRRCAALRGGDPKRIRGMDMGEGMTDKLYIGIDLQEEYAMLSYFYPGMARPATISFIAGSSDYRLPLVMAKRNGINQWVYGPEAKHLAGGGKGVAVDRIYSRALAKESVAVDGRDYDAGELFVLYLKKILSIPNKLDRHREIGYLTVAVREVNNACIELFANVRERLRLEKGQFEMIDYKECFYFYSCNQEEALQNHQVGLFDGGAGRMRWLCLRKESGTKPIVVEIEENDLGEFTSSQEDAQKDLRLLSVAKEMFRQKIISTVYFVGEAFEGNWMDEALRFICRGRRAFLGKNLYSVGACFASYQKNSPDWPYIYLGESAFKMNISLKVRRKNDLEFFTLVTAGQNWYHGEHSCQVILDGTNAIDLWLQHPYGREAKIESLEIADLPKRPERTTRIEIHAKLISGNRVQITLTDMGFGELYPSSGKVWKYVMDF